MSSARRKIHLLITQAGSFLGVNLAKYYLDQNYVVYGASSTHLPHELLSHDNFTLIDIDLSQPLPRHLPLFDLIFDLTPLSRHHSTDTGHHMPQTTNLIAYSESTGSRLFIFAPLTSDVQAFKLDKNTNLILIGDVYGPGVGEYHNQHPTNTQNELTDLISQAARGDKVVLANEGLDPIYPAYIKDVIFALNKLVLENQKPQKAHYITSGPVQTALTCAYEIQNALAVETGKNIGLFFSGPATDHNIKSKVEIGLHDLEFAPKFHLKEGLRRTFQNLAENNQIEMMTEVTNSKSKQAISPPEPQGIVNFTKHRQLPRLPQPQLNFNLPKLLLVALLILTATCAKTALDLYLANSAIKKAESSISKGQLKDAATYTQNAANSFQAAKNKVSILTFPFAPVAKEPVEAATNALEGLILGTNALVSMLEASGQLATDVAATILPQEKGEIKNQDSTIASFQKAHRQANIAAELLKTAQRKAPIFEKNLGAAAQSFTKVASLAQSAYEITSLTDELTGGAPKTYLVLLQNNTELRPGGGFIGNLALLEFEESKLKNISVEDVYVVDGQLQEEIEPPAQLKEKLGAQRLYLRDSNWSADFKINAATARDFFKKETGKNVDGVIALDLTFVQNLLAKIGPVTLADYNEQITAENLFEKGEYYSEIGFFPGSTQKRDFFGALTRTVINKMVTDLSVETSTTPWIDIIAASKEALQEKHFMMTFDNPNLASYIALHGWDRPLPPQSFNPADDANETRDFIAISEANLGANKVNRFLKREILYDVTIGRDADLVAKLTISYTNESQAETWPAGKYVNYLRVYVPFASGLLEVNNGGNTDLDQVEITNQGNLTTFATYVEVPIKSKREITFSYRIPKNIKLETAPTYHLYVSKQPGTGSDPFTFTFNLPQYLENQDGNQNLTANTDLKEDRQFTIEVIKK